VNFLLGNRAGGPSIKTKHLTSLRNPAVERSFTEMRNVVTAIVREYDKPYEIPVELARDLKNLGSRE
jgi:CRISPR/Cas system Type II protein with McrA/HNH and RuvC-like nuclease domain